MIDPKLTSVKEFRLKLYPKDFKLVRDFYEHKLGFPVFHEWDNGPVNKGVMFSVGSTTLELLSPADGYKPVQGADVSWEVTDVNSLWEKLKDNTPIVHGLRHNSWGDTSFRITDPEGFHISFFTKDK
ncbi:MAG: hypothetical protein QG553_616 [Patescibacteria group bacterium]|nr:hypothetical protein [Patescibacteria group bacterium]